ncbi:hypothetical protein Tco_0572249 [Tanacetum coccineum]
MVVKYNLLKDTCTSSMELEYNFQECFNALTDKLDWNNPKGYHYPFDLSKPLPLQGRLGHLTIAADYFFNNDLEYLKYSDPERTSQMNKFSKQNVYSTQKILGVKSVSVKKLHGYGHLEEVVVKRADQQLYKFKEVALRMFTRSLVIKHRVEDLQLSVESYQKKLNITTPQQTFLEIEFKELYTPSHKPPGIRGDDEEVLTDVELSDLKEENLNEDTEIAELFRIETDIFNFETPLCKAFKEFNYLLKIYVDVADRPWLDYGPWMEPCDDIEHVCKPIHFKSGHAKWPTYNWKKEKYCNEGDLPGMIQIGEMIYFKDYEWYEGLEDGELKDEALINKAILEGQKKVEEESNHAGKTNDDDTVQADQGWFDNHEPMENYDDDIGDLDDYLIPNEGPYYVDEDEERSKERRCKLLKISYLKPPTCKSEKFEVVKYSFGPAEEYVAIKEYEYDIWVKPKKTCLKSTMIFFVRRTKDGS